MSKKGGNVRLRVLLSAAVVALGAFVGTAGAVLGGTNIVLGINSFVANGICAGNTYSYRADTAEALGWVRSTVAAEGGSLNP